MEGEGGLPPGQSAIDTMLLRHIGAIPPFDPKTWTLKISGLVETPQTLTWDDFLKLPKISQISDFHCVEGWSVLKNRWEGVLFKEIVNSAKPKREARYVTLQCDDDYSTFLQLEDLMDDDVLLAYKLNNKELKPENGGPLRLIVPKKYAYKSPMWLRRMIFTSEREPGYWEKKGYSYTADAWKEDRYERTKGS
ncbi:MAG: molybdopterin-dependent oxidoreductase [Candidatus Bathyarchaeota archaeon]|nr:MAG: molybdopterin-dependent oxidoreductase [Candidatus Bathyarchaeota archaeon]